MQLVRFIIASIFLVILIAVPASADTVTIDDQGTLHYQVPTSKVTITRNGKITLNDKLLADCSPRKALDFEDMQGNEVTCAGSAISIELADGSEIDIMGSMIAVEDPNGQDFSLRYHDAPGTSIAPSSTETSVQTGNTNMAISGGDVAVAVPGLGTSITTGTSSVNVGLGASGISVTAPGVDIDVEGGNFVGIDGNQANTKVDSPEVEVNTAWRTEVSEHTKGLQVDSLIKEMKVEQTSSGLKVEMAGDVLFDFNSDQIQSDAVESLAKISQIVRAKLKNRVVVVGHTDAKGSNSYNQKLSERRALSVIRWLDNKESIPGYYLYAQGKGEMQPKAPNTKSNGSDYPQGRAINRRVEIYIQ